MYLFRQTHALWLYLDDPLLTAALLITWDIISLIFWRCSLWSADLHRNYLYCVDLRIGLVFAFVNASEGSSTQQGNYSELLLELFFCFKVQLHLFEFYNRCINFHSIPKKKNQFILLFGTSIDHVILDSCSNCSNRKKCFTPCSILSQIETYL